LKISPNPASTVAIIDLSLPTQALTSPTQATVRFYSIDGQLAKTETINDLLTEQHTVGINLAGLAAGMYLVEVATPAWRVAKPLLIQTAN
ncbi:MAG TPA: T9SS type A sorting domain-containing protein, partial [Chitinophagales bacterium]|nr:T9SS type A sorting domain-containing protein [Chitinophagales bacterium]